MHQQRDGMVWQGGAVIYADFGALRAIANKLHRCMAWMSNQQRIQNGFHFPTRAHRHKPLPLAHMASALRREAVQVLITVAEGVCGLRATVEKLQQRDGHIMAFVHKNVGKFSA